MLWIRQLNNISCIVFGEGIECVGFSKSRDIDAGKGRTRLGALLVSLDSLVAAVVSDWW